MATPPVTREQAKIAYRLLNEALADGFLLEGKPSAYEEGARRLRELEPKTDRGAFCNRIKRGGVLYNFKVKVPKAPKALPPEKSAKIGGTPEHRKIVEQEDEIRRLNSALREAHREQLNDDAMRALLGTLRDTPVQPPSWLTKPIPKVVGKHAPEVPVAMWADWHLGERVDPEEVNHVNGYNVEIAKVRVDRLYNKTINLCQNHHTGNYPGIVINLAGDFVSGGLHPELAKTDELESLPAALLARDLLVDGLTRMADTFGKVYVPCAAGNHGRNTLKPEFKRYVYKNFDWLIYELLIRHFQNDKRIHIDIRPTNDVHYRVFGQRYLLLHGDMLGVNGGDGIIGAIGPIMRGEFKKARQSGVIGLEYDMLLMGHWHQQLWLPRAIVSNTLKGWDEFARLRLGAPPSRPTQPLWFVHPEHGMTSKWDIYVDEAPKAQNDDWITVFKDAA